MFATFVLISFYVIASRLRTGAYAAACHSSCVWWCAEGEIAIERCLGWLRGRDGASLQGPRRLESSTKIVFRLLFHLTRFAKS